MFDTTSPIEIDLRTASAGKAHIELRWPTDEEWAQHNHKRKVIQKTLGRGRSEMDVDSTAADHWLYEQIHVNGAPTLTPAEASRLIGAINPCDVIDVQLGNDDAGVELSIITGEVKHTLKIPNMDQVRTLQRSARVIQLQYGRQEIRTDLEAAARLWDQCKIATEGYAGAVPNIHKSAAIYALISAIEQEVAPKNAENF